VGGQASEWQPLLLVRKIELSWVAQAGIRLARAATAQDVRHAFPRLICSLIAIQRCFRFEFLVIYLQLDMAEGSFSLITGFHHSSSQHFNGEKLVHVGGIRLCYLCPMTLWLAALPAALASLNVVFHHPTDSRDIRGRSFPAVSHGLSQRDLVLSYRIHLYLPCSIDAFFLRLCVLLHLVNTCFSRLSLALA
jgi:hypothetical protein